MKWLWLFVIVVFASPVSLVSSAVAAEAAEAAEVAEEALRDHLTKQAPAWYDRTADAWQRVAVKPPEPPQERANNGGGSLLVADVVAWLLVIAVVVALVWLAVQLWPNQALAERAPDEPQRPVLARPHAIAELDLGDERDPEAALAAARAAGDWRRAIVWIYALLLVRLDATGAIRLRKGATNQRYVREAQQWTRAQRGLELGLVPCLNLTISAFEQVYFGGLNATQVQVEGLEAHVRSTMALLPAESVGPVRSIS